MSWSTSLNVACSRHNSCKNGSFSVKQQSLPHYKCYEEEFEDTKGVIRIRKSKAKRKRTNNDLQNTTQKTIDRVTQTPLKKYMYFNIVVDLWIYCTGSAIVLQFSFHYVCNISGHVCIKIVDIKFSTHLLIALYVTFYYLFKFESPYSFQYL